MNEKQQKLERAVGAAMACLRDLSANMTAKETLDYINSLLAPTPPEIEEVEVVRWAVIAPSGYVEMTSSSEEVSNKEVSSDGRYPCYQVIKLTGTLKRPKPQPVERTVSVKGRVDQSGTARERNGYTAMLFRDHPECHGRHGIVSFTWTEDPK